MNCLPTAVAGLLLLLAPCSHAISVRVLAWDQQIAGRKLAVNNAKGRVEIQNMHPTQRTGAIPITPAEKSPPLLLALDKPDKEGNPAATKIVIPKGMKQPLMLLLPDPKSPTGIRPLLFDDNSENFPWASIRLINTTGRKLAFTAEKKALVLPKTWKAQTIMPGGSNRNFEVQLFTPDQQKRPIYSAMWEHRQEFRTLAFIVASDNPRLGPLAIKTIHEDRRAIEASNKSTTR